MSVLDTTPKRVVHDKEKVTKIISTVTYAATSTHRSYQVWATVWEQEYEYAWRCDDVDNNAPSHPDGWTDEYLQRESFQVAHGKQTGWYRRTYGGWSHLITPQWWIVYTSNGTYTP